MADNKSCEGKLTTLECMECGYREVFTERQFKCTDGLSCDVCDSPTRPVLTRSGEKINNRRMKKHYAKPSTINTTLDVPDVIKGLKAIQREARKATAALKELESIESKIESAYGIPAELLKGNPNKVNEQYETFIKLMGIQEAGP